MKLAVSKSKRSGEGHGVGDGADDRAVARRGESHVLACPRVTRARHVLGHDRRIAGNELHHVARGEAGIDIVTAARAGRDDEPHLLALVEIGDRFGGKRGMARGKKRDTRGGNKGTAGEC
jgi:hypothetical protein